MLKVKICGITRLEDAQCAVAAGADALGFILYRKSPRYIPPYRAAEIIAQLPPLVATVAVLVNPTLEEIRTAELGPFSEWQLHGEESPELLTSLQPRRLVKALHLPWTGTTETLRAYEKTTTAFLLDTPTPEYGGSGKTFDWDFVAAFRKQTAHPLILSGGLTADNIGEAVRRVQPYGVDVSSGVEVDNAPGIKDPEKIRAFITACRKIANP